MSAGSGQLQGANKGGVRRREKGCGSCVCVCLFVCLNPLKYHMYNKALFSSCRLCRAISSPYTLVCVCVCCCWIPWLQKKYRSLQRSKPGRNVRKEMYGPFPPRGDVRPTKSECILRLCNKEPTKKRNVPEVSSMAQHPWAPRQKEKKWNPSPLHAGQWRGKQHYTKGAQLYKTSKGTPRKI